MALVPTDAKCSHSPGLLTRGEMGEGFNTVVQRVLDANAVEELPDVEVISHLVRHFFAIPVVYNGVGSFVVAGSLQVLQLLGQRALDFQ